MTENNSKKVVPWRKSQAKERIREQLLKDDSLMDVDEHVIYQMSEDHKQYEESRFVSNVKSLKKVIKEEKERVAFEEAAMINDRQKFPKAGMTYWKYIRFDTSEAKEALRKDVKEKLHTTMKPQVLQQTNESYQQFPLAVFRKHIYQEEYAQLGRSYWMNKKKEKAEREKAAKKKAKKMNREDRDPLFDKTVAQLKDDLRSYNLRVSGVKKDLVLRLRAHLDTF